MKPTRTLLAAALALAWAAPLCAMPAPRADAHACCPSDEPPAAPQPEASCCQDAPALPPAPAALPAAAALVPARAPVLAPASAVFAGRAAVSAVLLPDAPPGASSGLSPPASGL
ncbi:MAG: hypothetical protein SF051_16130 [Elusimicrobiota bacterium]|nr:hypothetical protein [Elusimicrobiota bacterium]